MKYAPVCAFLLVFVCTPCKGQNKIDLPKDTIKYHGPTTSVRTIKQDRKGNIWLASNEGIIRYDGKSFTNITTNLSSDRFFSMVEDRNGNFWFGTYGSGVYYYDGKSFQHVTTEQGLANNQVSTIYEDKAGTIWFGTNGGVSRYDGKSFRNFTIEGGLSTNDVNAILEDKTGKLWFGTRGYTYVYDGKTFSFFSHKGTSFGDIWSIIEDRKGTIWLGGGNGLWRFDSGTITQFTQNPILRVFEDKKGNIWTISQIAPGRFGLFRYDEKSLSDKKPAVTEIAQSLNLFGILQATDGRIWFGAYDGVYRCDGTTITNFKKKVDQK
ncbi:histidine kinase [Spirosoma sp. KCTC 42546]|uniref:ligand-binding sensor domain-containing protein n=1 Tax=Spirosoma sp. KCTC 42546 TaxID=2520506 RepID=UPI0011584139|nr:two-component regulator propeller domain-containing protein [Spirosoma sp. KCTC 42546]QDK81111.1 histidine kinase [Spirosoma sp. KCTC 42546]